MSQRGTGLDQAMQSKALFWGFVGVIGVVAAYSIWGGGDLFPKVEQQAKQAKAKVDEKIQEHKKLEPIDYRWLNGLNGLNHRTLQHEHLELRPKVELSGSPEKWSKDDMEAWLKSRKVMVTGHEGKQELIAMVESTMHAPGASYDSSSSSSTSSSTTKVELKGSADSWSEDDMEAWLKSRKVMTTGHEGKPELIAMVESTMNAPI